MRLFSTETDKVSTKIIEVKKGIGAITFKTSKTILELLDEKIDIEIQRANGDNVQITKGIIPLKDFLVLGTMQENAIGCDVKLNLATKATVALTEHDMTAIHLHENETLLISFFGLDETEVYILDGHEAPLTTDDVYSYERKSMSSEQENIDFDVKGFDACVITDKSSISEINLRFDNGSVVKTTPSELRDLFEAFDPIAQVNLDGSVLASFTDLLQLPLKGIVSINVRKAQGEIINLLLRADVDVVNL
jgi:hypothetical protein